MEVELEIRKAKTYADLISTVWQKQPTLDAQTEGENAMLRKANNQLDLVSAQKSVLIGALKTALGDEEYDRIRGDVLSSDQFKSLTMHSDGEN